MKENRNDRQYGQSFSTQQQKNKEQSNEGNLSRNQTTRGSQLDSESIDQEDPETFMDQKQGFRNQSPMNQRSGEYSSSDEMDDLEEEDDETISMIDEDEDDDIFGDDENSQKNQRGR